MEMSSKLARQLAFKKKLGEKYNGKQNKREEADHDTEKDMDHTDKDKMKEEDNVRESNQCKKEKWLKKREEYTARTAKFSDLKRKRLDKKKSMEEQSDTIENKNIWEDIENIIKDNQMALKGLENYKVTLEITEREEKIKQIQSNNSNKRDSWFVPLSELHYDIESKIGQGKFGSVYSGSFRKNMPVAVKILKNKNGSKTKLIKDFLIEKKVMIRLKHPNLVQLYAVSRDDEGNDILVQEQMVNGSLSDYLISIGSMENRYDIEETSFKSILSWCVQIARGMSHLESLKIVHRDLAARNVLLDENKRAKVADFGMALSGRQAQTDCDYLPVRWTAPEAIFDKKFSSASDVWSFGITMWEIFMFGEKPYKTLSIKEYKERIRKDYEMKKNEFRCEQPSQVSKVTDKEQKDVYHIMTKCWNINLTERPKFCDLEEDLHHFYLTGDLKQ